MSAPPEDAAPAGAHGRRLAISTAIFAGGTALSRVVGLVRESVARYYFGTVGAINAFEVAFLIPNTVRALVADAALSSAFVPVFSELLEKGDRKRAWRVASTLLWLVFLGLGGLTALFILIAPWVMRLFGYGNDAAGFSRVLFPIVVILGLSGIVVGILNTHDHFTVPAFSPVLWNVAIIAGLVLGVPRAESENRQLYIYAFSILVATILQLFLPLPWLKNRDGRLQMVFDWRDPAVRKTLKLMLPITLGLGLINLNAFVDTIFATRKLDKFQAPSSINAAFRLYIFPQGIFSVAVATVLFPSLSRLSTRGDMDGFRSTVASGLRQIAFLLIPASVVCAVLAEPIVRIVYQHGKFTAAQTDVVAACLAAFAIGLTFNGAMLMLNRGVFSMQVAWIPTWIAIGNLGLNALLDLAFYRLGIWGLPLATSLVNIAGAAALLVLLHRRLGHMELGQTIHTVVRVTAASVVLAGVSYGVWRGLDEWLGERFVAQVISLGTALALGGLVFLGVCRLLGVRELQAVLDLRRRARVPAPPD